MLPNSKLRIDNQLFIDRPYVPTYKQEYSLNSKLIQLKQDYNEFQSRVKEIQEFQNIPQRSNSRRKQYVKDANHQAQYQQNNNTRNHYAHKKVQSNVFHPYPQDKRLSQGKKNSIDDNRSMAKSNPRAAGGYQYQEPTIGNNSFKNDNLNVGFSQANQKQNNSYKYSQSVKPPYLLSQSPHKRQLQSSLQQSLVQTQKLIKSQNRLQNKLYQQQNVLKQSQINHIFNWKLPQQESNPIRVKQTTIPKYKIQNKSLESQQRANTFTNRQNNTLLNNHNNTFSNKQNNTLSNNTNNINNYGTAPYNDQRNNLPQTGLHNNRQKFTNQTNSIQQTGYNRQGAENQNYRNRIVPTQKLFNQINKTSNAMQRRRIAKQNIDQRRDKLNKLLKKNYI